MFLIFSEPSVCQVLLPATPTYVCKPPPHSRSVCPRVEKKSIYLKRLLQNLSPTESAPRDTKAR